VHHVRHIAAGGTHELTNLRLLCHACHTAEHPDNEKLSDFATRNHRKTRRYRRRKFLR
jgi:5-methylcytosine-specific restriction endonuclease McrA